MTDFMTSDGELAELEEWTYSWRIDRDEATSAINKATLATNTNTPPRYMTDICDRHFRSFSSSLANCFHMVSTNRDKIECNFLLALIFLY